MAKWREHDVIRNRQSDMAAESRLLTRRAVWGGAVFSLATLLCVLNALPPVGIEYRIQNRILMSHVRFDKLLDVAHDDAATWFESDQPVKILNVEILDGEESGTDNLLVNLTTKWQTAYSRTFLQECLQRWTMPEIADVDQTLARQDAFASWQLRTAKHYVDHFRCQQPRSSAVTAVASGSVAAATATLASYSVPNSVSVGGGKEVSAERELSANVAAAEDQIAAIHQRWQQSLTKSSGMLELTDAADQQPLSSNIPLWMAASVIVLGLSAASCAGWTQNRLQSGGVFDPAKVARLLASDGIALRGTVNLDRSLLQQDDWLERTRLNASKWSRRFASRMTQISEWVLWFWVYIIAFRLVLDPMWRNVLWDSPLAGLGRVLIGLP